MQAGILSPGDLRTAMDKESLFDYDVALAAKGRRGVVMAFPILEGKLSHREDARVLINHGAYRSELLLASIIRWQNGTKEDLRNLNELLYDNFESEGKFELVEDGSRRALEGISICGLGSYVGNRRPSVEISMNFTGVGNSSGSHFGGQPSQN